MSEKLFKFTWTLENVTAWEYDRRIEGPCFVVKELGNAAFYLEWNGRGDIPGHCHLSLQRKGRADTPEQVKLRYHLKLSKEPTGYVSDQDVIFDYKGGQVWYIENYSILERDAWFLRSGEIQIECTILKPENSVLLPMERPSKGLDGCVERSTRTRMKTRTVSVKWNIKHFSSLRLGEEQSTEIFLPCENSPRFLATLFMSDEVYEQGAVEMSIRNLRELEAVPTFVACKATFGEEEGTKIVKVDKHVFDSENAYSIWKVPLRIRKMRVVKHEDILQDDVLPILLEFKVEEGLEFSITERSVCEVDAPAKKPDIKTIQTSRKLSETKQNLLALLKDQKLCDVRLETATESIGAHTGILCASSPVFAGMFEHDMLENATRTIQITVVAFETLERFLRCLYAEQLEGDLEVKEASELYFAADYYQVGFLKSECSVFLKNNMKVENVCDLLSLADRFQDKGLMDSVKGFIRRRKSQVLDSEEWKKLSIERPQLVIAIFQCLCKDDF